MSLYVNMPGCERKRGLSGAVCQYIMLTEERCEAAALMFSRLVSANAISLLDLVVSNFAELLLTSAL